ncbi:amidohydrolase [Desulfobacterota bacterium AH_259_B03_O07]|nr:amidohydrolase [Desulfobacterota bacterium AH_259_B03_O07]
MRIYWTRKMRNIIYALAIIVGFFAADSGWADTADYVFTNGKIYTVNKAQPWAEAVAVDGNKIVYVGNNAGAAKFNGKGTKSIDLKGRLMLPGFIESHIHISLGASTKSGVILATSDNLEKVLEKVKKYADEHPKKETIFGASYDAFMFKKSNGRYKEPNKALLDKIVPDRPVLLLDHTAHSAWVNSKTLELAGITKDTKNPYGGEYIRDKKNKELTGAIKGIPVYNSVSDKINAITVESIQASLPEVLKNLTEFGFTTAIDMGIATAREAAYKAIVKLDKDGMLPLRISMTHFVNTPDLAKTAVETLDGYAKKYKSDHVWIDTLKITIDSVLENQGAAMLKPYKKKNKDDKDNDGILYFDHEEMKKMVMGAAKKGYNVVVHAIGDRAVRAALDAAEALRKAGYKDTRFIITHAQMVNPDDRPRFKTLDVTVQTTGNWAMQQKVYLESLEEGRYNTLQFPFRFWADNGVNIALGADWPATPGGFKLGVNPFNNIYTSMHRRPPAAIVSKMGSTNEPLPPVDQVLTLEEAVWAYTIGCAKMLGIEDQIGLIEVGKMADMILLSQNLFEIAPPGHPEDQGSGHDDGRQDPLRSSINSKFEESDLVDLRTA